MHTVCCVGKGIPTYLRRRREKKVSNKIQTKKVYQEHSRLNVHDKKKKKEIGKLQLCRLLGSFKIRHTSKISSKL